MHDVIIVGAGPSGSASAYFLAKQGLDVLIVDKADFPRDKTCGDGLSPRALSVLDEMGILNDLLRVGNRLREIEIFAPKGHSIFAQVPKKGDLPDYAVVLPRFTLDNLILERARAVGVKFQNTLHVLNIEQDENAVSVIGEHHGQLIKIQGRIAIIATGASTKLLLRIGLLKKVPPLMLASRAYFENVTELVPRFQFHFDGVPLPGYGWVFPLSEESANIGAGFFRTGLAASRMPDTSKTAFDAFIHTEPIRRMLGSSRRLSPIKGYPLRIDFHNAPTFFQRVIVVGEAAGLVNPLTGEGIDYALESGKLAAEHVAWMFAAGGFSSESFVLYDQLLRQRFHHQFVFTIRMRDLFINHLFLDRVIRAAARRSEIKMMLINIALGNQDAAEGVSLKTLGKIILSS